ncbi:hypothetical protein B0T11DRAFT_297706 [Plectosphaerella cucumerina]|uniref:Uncharacterized protein n=1 Tax=Plectosphaerella cucumerina TaxID=40658 RepID=A0A8K0X3J5_9PEZI|nr:hypothetical protein B0T11DRAFT_297706 [Plectosphaerella cucumerina]
MLSKILLPAMLAIFSIVSGLPTADPVDNVELFKRDDVLTDRDLELASLHGVDSMPSVTKRSPAAFKHAVIRRDNGDDITIWVHRSFVEERDPSLSGPLTERQVRPWDKFRPSTYPWSPRLSCTYYTHVDKTNSTSPLADSAAYLATWAKNTNGMFAAVSYTTPQGVIVWDTWSDFVVAGTNSGGNAVFSVGFPGSTRGQTAAVLTANIFDLVDHSHTHFKRKYGSTWRVEAEGKATCYQAIASHQNVPGLASWRLTGTKAVV